MICVGRCAGRQEPSSSSRRESPIILTEGQVGGHHGEERRLELGSGEIRLGDDKDRIRAREDAVDERKRAGAGGGRRQLRAAEEQAEGAAEHRKQQRLQRGERRG